MLSADLRPVLLGHTVYLSSHLCLL